MSSVPTDISCFLSTLVSAVVLSSICDCYRAAVQKINNKKDKLKFCQSGFI